MGDDLDDTAIVWFRRDLRVHDQPIFDVAATRAKRSLAVFVLDEALLGPSGKARRTFLYRQPARRSTSRWAGGCSSSGATPPR